MMLNAAAPSGTVAVGSKANTFCINSVDLEGGESSKVTVRWRDGRLSVFHSRWLLANCPSRWQSGTGQVMELGFPADATVANAILTNGGKTLTLHWSFKHTSVFDSNYLRIYDYSMDAVMARKRLVDPIAGLPVQSNQSIPRVNHDEVMKDDGALLRWTTALEERGICIVEDVPTVSESIRAISGRICHPMVTLYGTTFDVKVEESAINIAYTTAELGFHMDLPYYESPPGIQMLHCLQFDSSIEGGESVFIDAFALADLLRKKDPVAFKTLCRIPATFQKNHLQRAVPAQYFYQRPHISVNKDGDVIAVHWSPPFEGPLHCAAEDVEEYYRAYDLFKGLMKDEEILKEWLIEFRLKPGEMVSFNQRRLLHGRRGFDHSSNGVRHLQGIYLPADDWASKHRYLKARSGRAPIGVEHLKRTGNSSHI